MLDSELYIDQAVDTFHVELWGQKMMYLYYAFCSPEWEVGFAGLWNFTIYCFPETKTDLLEIFLQLRLYVPWCNSLGQSPDRCKKICLISHFELWTSVYLGLHLSIDISLGRSHRESFINAETVCMNGNSFLDGEQPYLNIYYLTANIFGTKVNAASITTRHCGRRNKSINKCRITKDLVSSARSEVKK